MFVQFTTVKIKLFSVCLTNANIRKVQKLISENLM